MKLSIHSLALFALRLLFPGRNTWVVKTLIASGIGLIARPIWEPLLIAVLHNYVELDIPDTDWAGWVLLALGISAHLLHEILPPKPNQHDIALFRKFRELFSDPTHIPFFDQHNFMASFSKHYFDALSEFSDTWIDAQHEFVDPDLEDARKKLHGAARALATSIARGTTQIGTTERLSVIPDHHRGHEIPDWIRHDAQQIMDLAPAYVHAHETFVRVANSRLAII